MRSCVYALACALATATSFPVPEVQTTAQGLLVRAHALQAAAASEAATPRVLDVFRSPIFKDAIRGCCPEAAALPAEELLQRFRAEVRVAELAHAFPGWPRSSAGTPLDTDFVDVSIADLQERPWFLNEWQAKLLRGTQASKNITQNVAEQEYFGCAEFKGPSPSWAEASERLIYTAHNMRQVDTGSNPVYGDVTAIFSNQYVWNMTLVTPTDTGFYTDACLGTRQHKSPALEMVNCSAWTPRIVGTLDHFDHLILAGWSAVRTRSVIEEARHLFERSAFNSRGYAELPRIGWIGLGRYWEANLLGNPRLPDSVKFLIGNFYALFGTEEGRSLQELCRQRSWPLVWALGTYGRGAVSTVLLPPRGNERLLDPASSKALTNASLSDSALDVFELTWTTVEQARAARSRVSPEQFGRWWEQLKLRLTRVAPLSATACRDTEGCIGVETNSARCVCGRADPRADVLV